MAKPTGLTIKELYEACKKEIDEGRGDMVVLLTRDDEGNGAHPLIYDFMHGESVNDFLKHVAHPPRGDEDDRYDGSNSVILG